MIPFDLVEPTTLQEAVALIDPDEPGVRPLAGGTALMLMMKAGVFAPTRLVSLQRIEATYSAIALSPDGALRIGAMATLTALEHTQDLGAAFPVIARALRTLSNVRVRNVARVGGALAHGDPHMDLPPVLAALGARVIAVGPKGTREIAVEDLYTGYYETVLARNELIAEVTVPPLAGRKAAYMKVTARSADDWPALGLAAAVRLDGDRLRDVRLVASAATEKVTRLKQAEAVLEGKAVTDAVLREAGEAAVGEASILADLRGSAAYKRELLRIHVGRAVRQALSDQQAH